MHVEMIDLTKLFGRDARYVVPLFQRPYVWEQGRNWEPLWDDVRRAAEMLATGDSTHPHFLGTIVLHQLETPVGHLEAREVIDGQQRLTTLQLLLAAAETVAKRHDAGRSARLLRKFLANDEDLVPADHPEQQWKVWPTNADREGFVAAMEAGGSSGRLGEARRWFEDQVGSWATETDDPETRLDHLAFAIRELLSLVAINLGANDDAQVIFETLNGRGTPLAAADLIKNLLFRRADAAGDDVEAIYIGAWAPFDQEPWRRQIRIGRENRARIDVFLTHWLTMRAVEEVPATEVFVHFANWLDRSKTPAKEVFGDLARYAAIYDTFDSYGGTDTAEDRFFTRLRAFDTTTLYPLLLHLWGRGDLAVDARRRVLTALDSYLVRRAVCGLTPKDYNNLFRDALTAVATDDRSADDVIVERLSTYEGENRRWPTDDEFRKSLHNAPLYETVTRARLRSILEGLEYVLRGGLTEQLSSTGGKLTIEHVMPQSWHANWAAPAGGDEGAAERDRILHTLGNLTLVTNRLNPTLSNGAWEYKRRALAEHSLLRLTTGTILTAPPGVTPQDWPSDAWDERMINRRSAALADLAITVWPGPALVQQPA